jgi:hypothetical protein
MPLNLRASQSWKNFSVPISYRIGEDREENRLFDAQNVFSNQGRLETRHGFSRLNSSAVGGGGEILSMTYFQQEDGTREILAKVDTVLYKVDTSGTVTSLKTGLTSTTKHRAITVNNRHIIAVESDGLFYYDGTNFESLGNAAPSVATVAKAAGGSLTDSTYRVKYSFYASSIGFETNASAQSATVVTSGSDNTIAVSGMDISATHSAIDKKRIYLKDVTAESDYLFIAEIDLATASYNITADSDSVQTAPITHAPPISGGAKYVAEFNRRIAYTGNNTYPSDLFFSESDLPDCYDDSLGAPRIALWGDGEPTGLGSGYYNGDNAFPYLVAFKKRSITLINSDFSTTVISKQLGCVSAESIRTINGDIFFLSAFGWRAISNGKLVVDPNSLLPITLGKGDIDDVFKSNGYEKELNKSDFENMFSVYYQELDQYMTFISQGSSTSHNEAFVYEFESRGFKRYAFQLDFSAAVEGEDSSGDNVIYLADSSGFIYTHSIKENRTDTDSAAASVDIEAFALMPWIFGDLDASRNYREFIVHAIASSDDITVRHWVNFSLDDALENTYSFPDPADGFILDQSKLDEDALSDPNRTVVKARGDINRVGYSVLIGFYQTATNGNMNLIRAQLDSSKNGNPN